MSKLRKERLESTRLFIAASMFGALGVFELGIAVLSLLTGNINGWVYLILAAIFIGTGVSYLLQGREVRGMSLDERLIAAAIFDHMARSGRESGDVTVIDVSSRDKMSVTSKDMDDSEETKTGSLEDLRAARKGRNASD